MTLLGGRVCVTNLTCDARRLPTCGHLGAVRRCAGAQVVNLIKAQIVLHDIETVLPPLDVGTNLVTEVMSR